jgi:hypothetical protein
MHCLRYLVECGADFSDGSLHMAVEHGMWEAVELHLELGADMFTCATGIQYNFRTKGLGSKKHSVLPHLLNCPNRNAAYRAVLEKLRSQLSQLDPDFLIDAVIYLDDDILKWTLRNFPRERDRINTLVFALGYPHLCSLLWWVDVKLGLRSYRVHQESKYKAGLLAVKAVLLSFGAKSVETTSEKWGVKGSSRALCACFEA